MKVFVTGATGFIGSAVVRELVAAGHQVLGLVRNDASAKKLANLGGEAHKGDLHDMKSLVAGAQACDGVIHLAFNDPASYDAPGLGASMQTDRAAIAVMGEALADSQRPFVGTSGTMVLAPGRLGSEDDVGDPRSAASFRVPSENDVLALARHGVRASVVRPAPSVHGEGEHGFVPMLIKLAREKGMSAYVGEGQNRWPAVHRLDAAKLFKLAVENGEAGARTMRWGMKEFLSARSPSRSQSSFGCRRCQSLPKKHHVISGPSSLSFRLTIPLPTHERARG